MTRTDLALRCTLLALAIALPAGTWIACSEADASPTQPIAFPHNIHAENEIDCAFCHEYADRQDAAGIPRRDVCVTCHAAMPQDAEAVQKIFQYEDANEEIPWVRLYTIKNYAHFSHKWHIRAEISCETCHGDIGHSERAVRQVEYSMDWCLSCHEERDAPVDCVVCHK